MQLQTAANRLDALGAPTRLRIFRLLVRAGTDGLPVGGIQSRLSIPGSTLTHHLRGLIAAGLIEQERQGAMLVCRADFRAMDELVDYLTAECCAEQQKDDAA